MVVGEDWEGEESSFIRVLRCSRKSNSLFGSERVKCGISAIKNTQREKIMLAKEELGVFHLESGNMLS